MAIYKIIASTVAALIAFNALQPMIEGIEKEATRTSTTISADLNRMLNAK